jgi:CRISPR system Cascade subunit CasE
MIASVYRLSRQEVKELRITDGYSIHRIVYDLFPESRISGPENEKGKGFLFVDKGGDYSGRQILILSDRSPQTPAQGTIESKTVPQSFLACIRYAFEVVMNPTKRDAKSGKTVAIIGTEPLLAWFISKSPKWGFRVDEKRLQVNQVGVQKFAHKSGKTITQSTATFKGILTVLDRDLFKRSFEGGIGRGRGFGFGLLQIVPLTE